MNWRELEGVIMQHTHSDHDAEKIFQAIAKYRESFRRATVNGAVNAILEEFDMMREE